LERAWRAIIFRRETSRRRPAAIRISTQENWRTMLSCARAVRDSAPRQNGDTSQRRDTTAGSSRDEVDLVDRKGLTGKCLMSSVSTAKVVYGWSSVRVERTPVAGSQDGLVGMAKSRRYQWNSQVNIPRPFLLGPRLPL